MPQSPREVADSIGYQDCLEIDIPVMEAFTTPPQTDELATVATAFVHSINRVIDALILPVYLIYWAKNVQVSECRAYNKITGDPAPYPISDKKTYDECLAEQLRLHEEWLQLRIDDPLPEIEFRRALNAITGVIMDSGDRGPNGFRALLATAIVNTWTAFETLSGDLWETALNCHPQELSQLKGRAKGEKKTEWKIEPSYLHRFGYDLRKSMGTILRQKYPYSSSKLVGQRRFGRC